VLRAGFHLKILRPVVRLVAVSMVHYLSSLKRSAQHLSCDYPMLSLVLVFAYADNNIAATVFVAAAFPIRVVFTCRHHLSGSVNPF
jgi:hypothetical protein